MRKYRKYDWPAIIDDFLKSGLNQTQFSKERDINPRYFNQQLNKYRRNEKESFTQVVLDTSQPSSPRLAGIALTIGRCKIHCDINTLRNTWPASFRV